MKDNSDNMSKCKCTLKYLCEYHWRMNHLKANKQGLMHIASGFRKDE